MNTPTTRAVETRASDIHIESAESGLRVRYRIDGVLREMEPPPMRLKNAIISRVKIMAKLAITAWPLNDQAPAPVQSFGKAGQQTTTPAAPPYEPFRTVKQPMK